MEKTQKEEIEARIKKLIGQYLTKILRWQFMIGYEFEDGNGKRTAIDAYSRCIVYSGNEVIIDSENMYEPAPGVQRREDDDYGILECIFDLQVKAFAPEVPIKVIDADVKDDGTIRIKLERGFRCAVIPWRDNPYEAWRIFCPDDKGNHLIYYGNGITEPA